MTRRRIDPPADSGRRLNVKLSQEDAVRSTLLATGAAMSLLFAVPSGAHELEEATGHLGKVTFSNSCDAKVQTELQRAIAMLHSFWYSAGKRRSAMCSKTTPPARSLTGASRRC